MSSRQAQLPEDLDAPTIGGMEAGETAYVVPWAMWADDRRRLWLIPSTSTHPAPAGTASMRVEVRRDGYHVWLVRGQHYTPEGKPDANSIPVAELHD